MRRFVLVAALVSLMLAPVMAWSAPRVVVSIAPVHHLVSGVMQGVGEPTLLIPPGASPHHYALRPSDMRALQAAEVIIWVGPELESMLERSLQSVPSGVTQIRLMKSPGMTLLATREGGIWDKHDHGHGHGHDHGHGHNHGHDHNHGHNHSHDHGHNHNHDHNPNHGHDHHQHAEKDAHIWLSPDNAAAIVRQTRDTLSERDPNNAQRYAANAEALLERLQTLDASLRSQLSAIGDRPFIVFHDAYQYFEQHYGLTPAGSITVDPSRAPGAQRVRDLRQRIIGSDAICVFSEPQFEPRIVRTLTEGTTARSGVLDPLGAELPASPDSYFQLLENLAESIVTCLTN